MLSVRISLRFGILNIFQLYLAQGGKNFTLTCKQLGDHFEDDSLNMAATR